MNLFGLTITRTHPDPDLHQNEVPVYAVLHTDGRIAYLGATLEAAEGVIRNSPPEGHYILKLAARVIGPA
jgi:hypothetical protein